MSTLLILSTIFFSCCATAVLSYISMAVMIGPWIESTIVLFATLFFGLFARHLAAQSRSKSIALVTAGSSVGGIIATACGFAFPTLYFLDEKLFSSWLSSPLYFSAIMAALTLSAGALGLLIANLFEQPLLVTEQLPFPIGELSHKMIAAQNNTRKAWELGAGFIASFGFGIFQKVSNFPSALAVTSTHTFRWLTLPAIKLPTLELPMLWAIGFVTGHVIAVPLGVGILSKIFITSPLHTSYFPHLRSMDFLFAFGSGMMVYGVFMSIFQLPQLFKEVFKKINSLSKDDAPRFTWRLSFFERTAWLFALIGNFFFFHYFNFSFPAQIFVLLFNAVCVYQLMLIGGKFGLAPMGRFATYVMFSGLFLFGFNAVQLTIVATFVEICGGVAVDILFGRKLAQLSDLDHQTVVKLQWLGLVASTLSIGVIFWLLITNLGLGSDRLLAQRALSRALTIDIQGFDLFALLAGALFGSILKDLKVNPIMVLGGLLMPLDWSIVLVAGGLSTYLVKDREAQYPFWSGIFAANSLWMIVQALIR
jgi:hypothetical protein